MYIIYVTKWFVHHILLYMNAYVIMENFNPTQKLRDDYNELQETLTQLQQLWDHDQPPSTLSLPYQFEATITECISERWILYGKRN